ncbi:hypothetical protein [Sorangium sp. So ce385]|uniref:hypothetical protein n=1 Tax=Sorangium sp. So ce385 TaxID=3133308 RepID=UPI003F5B2892
MGGVDRDPAGLLERVPELADLAKMNPGVRRAIEQGRPHAVYRRLFWMRWRERLLPRPGAAGAQLRALLDALLARRRLFLEPMRRSPWLMTMNGVGATVYGESDRDPEDGTYIKTLFFVFLFVPLYPFGSYLVANGAEARSWRFIARAPLGPALYAWQRAVALGITTVVALGAWNALAAARYTTVRIANALPYPVEVSVGDASIQVPAQGLERLEGRVGRRPVKVTARGRTIEEGELDVPRGTDVVAWNVLGLAPIYQLEVRYTADRSASSRDDAAPTLFCGQSAVIVDDVDFVFEPPPEQLSMPKGESFISRTLVTMAPVEPGGCAFALVGAGKAALGAELAARYAEHTDYDVPASERAVGLLMNAEDEQGAAAVADRARRAHPDSVELHRQYQKVMTMVGRRHELIDEYKGRHEGDPGSADAAYLYVRLLSGPAVNEALAGMLERFPDHPYLLRTLAYQASHDGKHQLALDTLEKLRGVDRALAEDSVALEVTAAVGLGQVERARSLVAAALAASQESPLERRELAEQALLLARLEPKASIERALDPLRGKGDEETALLRLRARVDAGLEVSAPELARVSDPALRSALELAVLLRADPRAAVARLTGAEKAVFHHLSLPVWVLLMAEAVHAEGAGAALAKLEQASLLGRAFTRGLIEYVRDGTRFSEIDDLPDAVRAALHFGRARHRALAAEERQSLLALARREDALHGAVSVAMESWPP